MKSECILVRLARSLAASRLAVSLVFAMAAISPLGSPLARATSAQWTGTTDSNWATTTNWSASPVPGTGDTATFGSTNNGHTTISLGAGVTIKTINFGNNTTGYTIGAGAVGSETLTLNDGGVIGIADVSPIGDVLIDAAVVLGTNANALSYDFADLHVGSTLTLAGNITGGTGGTAGTKTLTILGSTVISGVIGGGGGTIALSVGNFVPPMNAVTLSGTNSFTGAVTITAGKLIVPVVNNVNADGPLGHSAAPVQFAPVNGQATPTLEYTGGTASSSKPFSFSGGGVDTFQIDLAATNLTLSGLISGAATFQKSGAGTLTVTHANTYTFGTNISAGTLVLSGAAKLGATTGALFVNGALDLGGTSQTVDSLGGSGSIYNNGSGTSTLTVNSINNNSSFSGIIADNTNSGTGIVALTKMDAFSSLYLTGPNTYSGTTTISAGTLGLFGNGTLGNAVGGTTVSSGATLLVSGVDIPAEAITISGAGASTAFGALESHFGSTYGGLLKLGANATIYSNDGTFNMTNPGTITGPGFELTLAGFGNGSIASIIGTTTGGVTKSGTGTWTLSGANTYTGLTTISAGILNVQNASALGTTTNGTTITSGATLQIQGDITVGAEALTIRGAGAIASGATGALENVSGTNNYGGLVTLGAASTISSDAGTLSLTNGGTITGSTFALTLTGTGDGAIASKIGTGTVTKSGNGTWTLSGANTYTGDTTVTAGLLSIPNPFLGSTNNVNLASGSTLNLAFAGSDAIKQLRIDNIIQSAGTWGSPTSSATFKTSLISGSGILNVTSGAAQQPYASWIAAHNVTGPDSAFNADPNHDGVPNGLAWILGGDPLINSTSVLPQVSTDATYLFLTFNQIDAREPSTTLSAQWSNNLSSWNNVPIGATSSGPDANGVTVTVTENGTAPDTIVVAIPRSLGPGKVFARLFASMS